VPLSFFSALHQSTRDTYDLGCKFHLEPNRESIYMYIRFQENLAFELFCLIGKTRILKSACANGVATLRMPLQLAFNFLIL